MPGCWSRLSARTRSHSLSFTFQYGKKRGCAFEGRPFSFGHPAKKRFNPTHAKSEFCFVMFRSPSGRLKATENCLPDATVGFPGTRRRENGALALSFPFFLKKGGCLFAIHGGKRLVHTCKGMREMPVGIRNLK